MEHWSLTLSPPFEDTGYRKPHPITFRKVLTTIECEPQDTIMVGDWPERDLVGAREVGMHTIFARYGFVFDRPPVGKEGAEYVIDDIREILGIIDELNGTKGE